VARGRWFRHNPRHLSPRLPAERFSHRVRDPLDSAASASPPVAASRLKLSGDNLAANLARGLGHIYLVAGDEPLLVNEAVDAIRTRARADGFNERELYVVERGFDWQALRQNSRAMSLFADRKIVEIRMASPTPGEQGGDVLVELAGEPSPDTLVIVITGKLDGRTQNSRWVSAIERQGVFVQIWPIDLARLPGWIRERLGRHGLKAEPAAAALLAERVEGNLLAAHQEVEKLALLLPPGEVTAETVLEAVADSARFDVLQIGEAAMRAQSARALRVLEGVHGEGIDATLVLWALRKDLEWLARVLHRMRQGQSADAAMNAEYVWRPRQAAMRQALSRLTPGAVRGLLLDAARVDQAIKGVLRVDPWVELEALVARMAGVRLTRAA